MSSESLRTGGRQARRRGWSIVVPGLAVALLLAAASVARAELRRLDPELFPAFDELEANVAFWLDIFTKYSSHHVVLHDENRVDVRYVVLDFSGLERSQLSPIAKERRRQRVVRETQENYRALLWDLARGREPGDPQRAARVEELLGHLPEGRSKYRRAAQQLRSQTGLRDQFEKGLRRSGRYMPAIQQIFRSRGLPMDLTRLPFVESMFQEHARSRAAAGGIWQIIPSTGRRLLRIDHEVDERYDPLLASEAAARLLQENYERLGTWPLAITAYNYGRAGMRYAVRRLGTTDLGAIVTGHRGRTFGFASRNFYAEFLAAARIYNNREYFFPHIAPEPPLAFDEFVPDRYVSARVLARRADVPLEVLKELNPALDPDIWRGDLLLPRGYRLRLPVGSAHAVHAAYASLPDDHKPEHQVSTAYRVRRGDTLGRLAGRFGTTVAAIQRANGLRYADLIRVGQVLRIPVSTHWVPAPEPIPASGVHVVRRGETLWSIARRYGLCLSALVAVNRLVSSDHILVGQRLSIPTASSC